MFLVTVTNEKYVLNAINLIESYKFNSFNDRILFFALQLSDSSKKFLKNRYGEQIYIEDVPLVCDHAHDLRTFFYKVYTIKRAMEFENDFIYSDATNEIVKFTIELKKDLITTGGHLFFSYNHEMLKNKYWTTNQCFEKMDCLGEEFREAQQHWAGLQIYESSSKNKQFVDKMYDYALDIGVIGPDTTVKRPDGSEGICKEHRQDQSIFSLLIQKFGFLQPYNLEITQKYGDQQTMLDFDKGYKFDMNKVTILSRSSKFGSYNFLSKNIIKEYEQK